VDAAFWSDAATKATLAAAAKVAEDAAANARAVANAATLASRVANKVAQDAKDKVAAIGTTPIKKTYCN
jgi:hypothetical protein